MKPRVELSHIWPIALFPLLGPVVQTTPLGLTLPPAFCRMREGLYGSPSVSGIATPHDRAIPSMGFRHRPYQG